MRMHAHIHATVMPGGWQGCFVESVCLLRGRGRAASREADAVGVLRARAGAGDRPEVAGGLCCTHAALGACRTRSPGSVLYSCLRRRTLTPPCTCAQAALKQSGNSKAWLKRWRGCLLVAPMVGASAVPPAPVVALIRHVLEPLLPRSLMPNAVNPIGPISDVYVEVQ